MRHSNSGDRSLLHRLFDAAVVHQSLRGGSCGSSKYRRSHEGGEDCGYDAVSVLNAPQLDVFGGASVVLMQKHYQGQPT